jgi:hypothetical protein
MEPSTDIPAEFFQSLTDAEWRAILDRKGVLDRRLCRRLWAMLGRTDRPPDSVTLYFNREDIMREFPPLDKMH